MASLFCTLSFIAAAITLYALSPLHPKNITDETVVKKGTPYTVRLSGISDYSSKGFMPVTDGFYFTDSKSFVYTDENGYARTDKEDGGEVYVLGRYSSAFIDYEKYSFCGESYKNRQELEAFFKEPELIYDFDINNLGIYIQDIIQYKRHFSGMAEVKIYRGRCVITDVYVGAEKVLEYKIH